MLGQRESCWQISSRGQKLCDAGRRHRSLHVQCYQHQEVNGTSWTEIYCFFTLQYNSFNFCQVDVSSAHNFNLFVGYEINKVLERKLSYFLPARCTPIMFDSSDRLALNNPRYARNSSLHQKTLKVQIWYHRLHVVELRQSCSCRTNPDLLQ